MLANTRPLHPADASKRPEHLLSWKEPRISHHAPEEKTKVSSPFPKLCKT